MIYHENGKVIWGNMRLSIDETYTALQNLQKQCDLSKTEREFMQNTGYIDMLRLALSDLIEYHELNYIGDHTNASHASCRPPHSHKT